MLEVSRPALREAIRRLIAGGLLTARRGSGTYVAHVNLAQVFAIRLRLEPLAAELAAANRTSAEATRLRALVAKMKRAMAEPERFAAFDTEIHDLIATASRNHLLRDLLGQLAEQIRLSRSITSPSLAVRGAALRDITAAAEAIAKQQPKSAGDAMQAHIHSVDVNSASFESDGSASLRAAIESR